jgi:hypothetical protein
MQVSKYNRKTKKIVVQVVFVARISRILLTVFLVGSMLPCLLIAQDGDTTTIGGGTVTFLKDLQATLQEIGPALSAILFIVAGIVYAFGQLQPAEVRGKYQAWAMGLIVGAFVVGALSLAGDTLAAAAGNLL